MLIYFIKFIHLVTVIGLIGAAIYCLLLTLFPKFAAHFTNPSAKISRLNKTMLLLISIALLTGTLLVHPRHFTFHTPWIDAAYLAMICVGVVLLISSKFLLSRRVSLLVYLFLIATFLIVTYDAITKSTFIISN